MVLFYVWTDIQLINAVNTRCNFYKQEESDLLVLHLSRISDKYIDKIRDANVFHNVYILKLPSWYLERKRVGVREYLVSLINGIKLKNYFSYELERFFGNKKVDLILSGAFWGETMNVYRYFQRINPDVEVGFIEEGLGIYNGPKDWLYNTSPNLSVKARFREALYYGNLPRKAKRVVRIVYLYRPDFLQYETKLEIMKLPALTEKGNGYCYNIVSNLEERTVHELDKRKVIYIADAPRAMLKNPYEYVCQAFDMVLRNVDNDKLIVRLHPLSATKDFPFSYAIADNVIVDNGGEPFELKYFGADLSSKVIITNNSYVIYFLRICMEIEPYVIFLYHVCKINAFHETERNNNFVNHFIEAFTDKNRILVPKTEEEFRNAIGTHIR